MQTSQDPVRAPVSFPRAPMLCSAPAESEPVRFRIRV